MARHGLLQDYKRFQIHRNHFGYAQSCGVQMYPHTKSKIFANQISCSLQTACVCAATVMLPDLLQVPIIKSVSVSLRFDTITGFEMQHNLYYDDMCALQSMLSPFSLCCRFVFVCFSHIQNSVVTNLKGYYVKFPNYIRFQYFMVYLRDIFIG